MHYLFVELASINIKVSLNFFCEKHGKNSRDQHFSVVSNFIQQESMVKKLCTSQDICDAIEKRQMLANLNFLNWPNCSDDIVLCVYCKWAIETNI